MLVVEQAGVRPTGDGPARPSPLSLSNCSASTPQLDPATVSSVRGEGSVGAMYR